MDFDLPGIDPKLLETFKEFSKICKSKKVEFDIVTDEKDVQGYLIRREHDEKIDEITSELADVIEKNGVSMDVNGNHRQGTIFRFTIKALIDAEDFMRIEESQQNWPTRPYSKGYATYARPIQSQRRGVRSIARITEDANRMSDLDDLFDELISAVKIQDGSAIDAVGVMMSRLAEGSEALTEVITDAVNSARYFDINDVGYAYDRFRKTFFTKPLESIPARFTADAGQSVIVVEQIDVECEDEEGYTIPVNAIGLVEKSGRISSVLFDAGRDKISVSFTPTLAGRYLRPISSRLSNRLNDLLISEQVVEPPEIKPEVKEVDLSSHGIHGEDDKIEPLPEKLSKLETPVGYSKAEKAIWEALKRLYAMSKEYVASRRPNVLGAIWAGRDILARIPSGSSRAAYTDAVLFLENHFIDVLLDAGVEEPEVPNDVADLEELIRPYVTEPRIRPQKEPSRPVFPQTGTREIPGEKGKGPMRIVGEL